MKYYLLIYAFIILIILPIISETAMKAESIVSKKLIGSVRDKNFYEIGEIKFVGNNSFDDEILSQIINSNPTERSFPHKVLQAYYNESRKNRAAPRVLMKEINTAIKSLEHEIRFFDETSIESDTLTLWHFYNTQGFHEVRIYYSFIPDFRRRTNILTFHINEGDRYTLDTVVYVGLDSVPPEVSKKLINKRTSKNIKYFNELALISEVNSIQEELLNSGYYFSSYEKPIVTLDTMAKSDSVTIIFSLGERVRVGSIFFVDSTRGQHIVTHQLKERMLDLKTGDWYSLRKVNNSLDNLLSIGTFESITFDTCRNLSAQIGELNFCLETNYRKLREWGVALFTNRTQLSNFNAGLEGSINHRNLFGNAQTANFYTTLSFKDLARIIQDVSNLDFELQVGTRITQPLLWTVGSARVGASSSLSYTIRTLHNFFQINTVSFPVRFPIKLSQRTYFNTMSIDFVFERENPVNYNSALTRALRDANTSQDTMKFLEAFFLYDNLHTYLNEPQIHIWTSNTIGFSLLGDNKNHQFEPSRGTYTYIGFDGWNVFLSHPSISGIARFFRFQFLHSHYFPIANNLVGAYKGRFGGIYLIDEANAYVPIDKQFFAGGSNSVRGWISRTLRYTSITADSLGSKSIYNYMQNFIGNGGLIEASFELRYKLKKPKGFSDFIAKHIGNIGITGFIDVGNAFHWYLGIEKTKLKVTDYFTKLAVAGGFGIGYNTPIGPLRVDFATPLHDPLGIEKPFRRVVFHLGIGHSF